MKQFLATYKYFLLVPTVVIVLFTLLLLFLSDGPQDGAFIYQLF